MEKNLKTQEEILTKEKEEVIITFQSELDELSERYEQLEKQKVYKNY